jgi:hypothetical protein
LILGKLLAALTPWPAAFLISIPTLIVVAQGNDVLGQALVVGGILGTALAVAFASFGLLVSTWCNSNKTSMFITLSVWLLLFLLTQLPGEVQKGDFGYFVQRINPIQASSEFLEKVLVNNRTIAEKAPYLRSSEIAVLIIPTLLFLVAAPRLRLVAGRGGRARARWGSLTGMVLAAAIVLGGAATAVADPLHQGTPTDLGLSLDRSVANVRAGDEIPFESLLENNSSENAPPVTLAMNIINLKGDVVDPEDWSPERTQKVNGLAPGDAVRHQWTIEAILKGDYMVYLVAIPKPDSSETTSQPVASTGLHLIVGEFTELNPGGVLPVVIFVPVGVALILLLVVRLRLRRLAQAGEDIEASSPDDEPIAEAP